LERIYLTVPFAQKDRAKALGARWDAASRKWYVPAGLEADAFREWLPDEALMDPASPPFAVGMPVDSQASVFGSESLPASRGIPLSGLLNQISQTIARAFAQPVWTTVEVLNARMNNGHVYLELSERDAGGRVLAKANGAIWASTAARILPRFEAATGAQIAPGIKLLVQARPTFKAQYGFSLEIVDIDPDFTLGDLEARKREIRARLQQEGLFGRNRALAAPWDYQRVLVLAPQGAAGLGDFQAEANRLETYGLCRFTYCFSRFQGEGAAGEMKAALARAFSSWATPQAGDAVVIIRGGGAVNDLAWLNDYDLARVVCEMTVPVLTGIGHERDSTILDEVANIRFDTPSKVIAGIERTIKARADEAWDAFSFVVATAQHAVKDARRITEQLDATIRSQAHRQVAMAREQSEKTMSTVRLATTTTLNRARHAAHMRFTEVRHGAGRQMDFARQAAPEVFSRVTDQAGLALDTARSRSRASLDAVTERARRDLQSQRAASHGLIEQVAILARRTVADATRQAESLMREVAGQGPGKAMSRGFAIVRGTDGTALTSVQDAARRQVVHIQFHDGRATARIQTSEQDSGDELQQLS
jgi:exodeoxyribonuclease VII large subunit